MLRVAGLQLSSIAMLAVPIAAVWFALALGLGRAQERRARAEQGAARH
jgi:hypothetical protein